jgi:hypothetical protein
MTMTSVAGADEQTRIAAVVTRLCERFPQVDPGRVAQAVAEAHRDLDGAHIRDFVPILVEKHARQDLEAGGAVRLSRA